MQAAPAVNNELLSLYWDLGQSIYKKQSVQGWGDGVVETLARDLTTAFPGVQGFSVTNLWRMRQLYVTYSAPAFLSQLVRETPGVEGEPGKPSRVVVKRFMVTVSRTAKGAGLDAQRFEKASTHWMRHTFVRQALVDGAPIEVASELAGHASIATTSIYPSQELARKIEVVWGMKRTAVTASVKS